MSDEQHPHEDPFLEVSELRRQEAVKQPVLLESESDDLAEVPCPACGYANWLYDSQNEDSFQCQGCNRKIDIQFDYSVTVYCSVEV